jgi:hypothetical protein
MPHICIVIGFDVAVNNIKVFTITMETQQYLTFLLLLASM